MKIVCSVFDKKAGVYCLPFFSQTQATAVRDFSSAIQDSASQVSKYAADYDLYQLAEWSEDTGVMQPLERPIFMCNGGPFKLEISE